MKEEVFCNGKKERKKTLKEKDEKTINW